jgi:tRNA A-37 threonylcarbamoyl transferase component Bud32
VEGVLGQYRIVKKLGEGGMGAVYLAEHTLLGRRAAVKVLQPNLSSNQDIVQRFFNEARAATAIADPGIVQIFDFGYHTDGSAYIVMEFLEGEPLDARLKRHGRLAPEEALRLLRQVASSLHAAHSRGIIHRDLKPENIFLVADREVAGGERAKILDFGIAKLSNNADSKVKTHTAAIMGTPMYMSPEQCRGAGHVDHRSDLYSLGCVLYHLVVGRVPFDGEGIGEIIAAHMMSAPPVPSQQAPGIPPGVDQLILRLLAKRPEERFANAGELAEACGALLGGSGTLPPSLTPIAATVMAPGTAPPGMITGAPSLTTLSGSATAAPVGGTVAPAAPKKRGGLIAVGAIAAVGAAIAAVVCSAVVVAAAATPARAPGRAAAAPERHRGAHAAPTPAVDTAAIAKLITDARAAADADKWADVTRLAGEALALDPQHADARALADTAKREAQSAIAYERFTAAFEREGHRRRGRRVPADRRRLGVQGPRPRRVRSAAPGLRRVDPRPGQEAGQGQEVRRPRLAGERRRAGVPRRRHRGARDRVQGRAHPQAGRHDGRDPGPGHRQRIGIGKYATGGQAGRYPGQGPRRHRRRRHPGCERKAAPPPMRASRPLARVAFS